MPEGRSVETQPDPGISISAMNNHGIDHLIIEMIYRLGAERVRPDQPIVFTQRQYDLLNNILHAEEASPGALFQELLFSSTL